MKNEIKQIQILYEERNRIMKKSHKKGSKPYFAYSASLRVMNAPELHNEISKITGIEPSECHCIGDIANVKSGRKWENDIWIISSPLSKYKDLTEHLRWLQKKIKPHFKYFKMLIKKGVKIDIFCGYSSDCDTAGFCIKPEALEIFVELEIPLEVSVIVC